MFKTIDLNMPPVSSIGKDDLITICMIPKSIECDFYLVGLNFFENSETHYKLISNNRNVYIEPLEVNFITGTFHFPVELCQVPFNGKHRSQFKVFFIKMTQNFAEFNSVTKLKLKYSIDNPLSRNGSSKLEIESFVPLGQLYFLRQETFTPESKFILKLLFATVFAFEPFLKLERFVDLPAEFARLTQFQRINYSMLPRVVFGLQKTLLRKKRSLLLLCDLAQASPLFFLRHFSMSDYTENLEKFVRKFAEAVGKIQSSRFRLNEAQMAKVRFFVLQIICKLSVFKFESAMGEFARMSRTLELDWTDFFAEVQVKGVSNSSFYYGLLSVGLTLRADEFDELAASFADERNRFRMEHFPDFLKALYHTSDVKRYSMGSAVEFFMANISDSKLRLPKLLVHFDKHLILNLFYIQAYCFELRGEDEGSG